jgi:hypothetical protein
VKEFILKATEILCSEKQQLFKTVSFFANREADRVSNLAENSVSLKKNEVL